MGVAWLSRQGAVRPIRGLMAAGQIAVIATTKSPGAPYRSGHDRLTRRCDPA
jgi:hypothetical protein